MTDPSTSIGRPTLLAVDDIVVRYGAIAALKGVSFTVAEGEIVALLGANGAGKTTTQKTVSGMMRPAAGTISFDGRRIDGVPPHSLIHLGVCHVPEGRHVFPRMTVAENLEMGAFRFRTIDRADFERVLAVNTDLHADMVKRADLAIIADAQEVMPALTRLARERLRGRDAP